jgi:hypothetical protein
MPVILANAAAPPIIVIAVTLALISNRTGQVPAAKQAYAKQAVANNGLSSRLSERCSRAVEIARRLRRRRTASLRKAGQRVGAKKQSSDKNSHCILLIACIENPRSQFWSRQVSQVECTRRSYRFCCLPGHPRKRRVGAWRDNRPEGLPSLVPRCWSWQAWTWLGLKAVRSHRNAARAGTQRRDVPVKLRADITAL